MSNMASCIGKFSILWMKNDDMLLFTTNIGIANITYGHCYKQHLHAMPIFVVYNNILAFFIHKIEKSLIQFAIFDIF